MKRAKSIFSVLVFILLISLVIYFVKSNKADLETLKSFPFWVIIPLFLLNALSTLMAGIKTKMLIQKVGKNLRFKEWFGISCINSLGNYITPLGGGASIKAVYLKKMHQIPYNQSVTLTGATFVTEFFAAGLISLIGTFLVDNKLNSALIIDIRIISILLLLVTGVIMLYPKIKLNFTKKPFFYITKILEDWNFIRKDIKMIISLIALDVFMILLIALRLDIIFSVLKVHPSILFCIISAAFSHISIFLMITPGGLGIKEGAISLFAKIWGYGVRIGLYGTTIDRIITTLWTLASGALFSMILLKKNLSSLEHVSKKSK